MKRKPNKSFGLNNKGLIIAICLIVIIVIVMLISPSLYMRFVVEDSIPEDLQNESWINFMGGYIAAIVGGVISLFGIMATILFTNEQNNKNRALQIKPYFALSKRDPLEKNYTKRPANVLFCGDGLESSNVKKDIVTLRLKNIGLGPANNIQLSFLPPVDKRNAWRGIFTESTDEIVYEAFAKDDFELLTITVAVVFDDINECDLELVGEHLQPTFKTLDKYPNFIIPIKLSYSDLLGNNYKQEFELQGLISTEGKNGNYQRSIELRLNDVQHITEIALSK